MKINDSSRTLTTSDRESNSGDWRVILSIWFLIAVAVCAWTLSQVKPVEKRMLYSDVTVHMMIASSIWNDLDLRYTPTDLARFRVDFPVESGPTGLFLKETAGGNLVYAKPYLYGATASVFYGAIGVDGFILLNSLCLFVIGMIAARVLTPALGERWAVIASVGFLIPGPFLAWVGVPHPDLFIAALLAVSGYCLLTAGQLGVRLILGVVFMAAILHEKPSFLILLPFLWLAMPRMRNLRATVVMVVVGGGTWALFSAPNLLADGTLLSYQGARFYVSRSPFPLETGWLLPKGTGITDHVFSPVLLASTLVGNLSIIPGKLLDFTFGRQTSILVYFPVAFLLLVLRFIAGRGIGLWLLFAFLAYLGVHWLAFPTNGYGGAGSYGPRYMMQALPLIPLAFYGLARPALQRAASKFALLFMCALTIPLHARTALYGADMIREHYIWYLQPPLALFPVETWLLPTTSTVYPATFFESSTATPEFLFHTSELNRHLLFGTWLDDETKRSVIFQAGPKRLIPDLELLSPRDTQAIVRHKSQVVWKGQLLGGQPHRLNLDPFTFDAEAYDLLDRQFKRYATLEVAANVDPSDHQGVSLVPTLRFANDYLVFERFDELLPVADLQGANVRMSGGWSHIEPWGVWSAGDSAALLLNVGTGGATFEVDFRLHGYAPSEDPVRNIQLSVNGQLLATLALKHEEGAREYRVRFRSRPDESFVHLVFDIQNPVSPASLGRGADPRRLGVGLLGFGIRTIKESLE